jgi:hypothetical protein
MEQEIAGRCDRLARSGPELAKRVKLGGARLAEQPIPGVLPKSHDAGQPGLEIAKFDGANQAREIGAERPRRRPIVSARVYRHDQEDRGARERRGHRLWNHGVGL